MFQTSNVAVARARLGLTRRPASDENCAVSRPTKGVAHPSALVGKAVKSITLPTSTALRSKQTAVAPGAQKLAGKPTTATVRAHGKADPRQRQALSNVNTTQSGEANPKAVVTKPATKARTATTGTKATLDAPLTRAKSASLRPAASNASKLLPSNLLRRKQSGTKLASSGVASRPLTRSRSSASMLARTTTTTTTQSSFGIGPRPNSVVDVAHPVVTAAVPFRPTDSSVFDDVDEACVIDRETTAMEVDQDGQLQTPTSDDFSPTADHDTSSVTDTATLIDQQSDLSELDPSSLEYILATFEEDVDPLDTTMVPEYTQDIFKYMRQMEVKLMPGSDYMAMQQELEWSMRRILVDWLVQVHQRFRLLPETLYLCVNYVDRFLSRKVVSLEKLQLVGATALLLAAKFEEIQVPSVSDFVYMVDHAYSVDEILKAERYMVAMLDFSLGFPGPMSFLRRISKADDYDIQIRTLAKYLIEVTIIDEACLPFPMSQVAATGHRMARKMLNKGDWTTAHVYYSGYTEAMLEDSTAALLKLIHDPKSHSAIYDKYADRKYMKASLFVSQWVAKHLD
ncbi:B-type cyclin [Dimargaris verticillata]|uniref:B-type cyclin n=1 Tax=Dimargaris verticillata TaxID=2761393 RepID=A0A9W8AZ63_9FUNG|nr:B-type cyclin [Dimargaris verticillata]